MVTTQKIANNLSLLLSRKVDSSLEEVLSSLKEQEEFKTLIEDFERLLEEFSRNEAVLKKLFKHQVGEGLREFLKRFPKGYLDAHAHLSGSLHSSFLLPKVLNILKGEEGEVFAQHIERVYGSGSSKIETEEDISKLLCCYDTLHFKDFLIKGLYLPKLIFIDKKTHVEAAEHVANTFYKNFNVKNLRLKFTLSRKTVDSFEQVPQSESVTFEDVLSGLFEGFKRFQRLHPDFQFTLSPSFRKEENFFDAKNFKSKQEYFEFLVDKLLEFLEKNPHLKENINEVDTVGDELYFYKEEHFLTLSRGIAKLKANGFKVRSHHGEVFFTLLEAVRAIGFAISLWRIDTLEHGLALGVKPKLYFERLKTKVLERNSKNQRVEQSRREFYELKDLEWGSREEVFQKLLKGERLSSREEEVFEERLLLKINQVKEAQEQVLKLLIKQGVSITSIPTTNKKLTELFVHYKEHPFTFWSSLGVRLNLGSDDYFPNNSDYLQEMLILLFANYKTLKINFLLKCASNAQEVEEVNQVLRGYKQKD